MKAKDLKKNKLHSRGRLSVEPVYVGANIKQISFIDSLVQFSLLSCLEKKSIHERLEVGLTEGEAEELIYYLKQNQSDPISCGRTYSQTDIKHKLKNILK